MLEYWLMAYSSLRHKSQCLKDLARLSFLAILWYGYLAEGQTSTSRLDNAADLSPLQPLQEEYQNGANTLNVNLLGFVVS